MAKTTAKCTCCNREFNVIHMVKTEMPNRGMRNAYMCTDCATRNQHYHTSNNELQGKAKKNSLRVGHELETAYNDDYARNILFEYGCIPTNDSSLHGMRTCEFVTGIQQGLNIGSKMAVTIEKLLRDGHLQINDSCGTHFHVSINNMENANGERVYMGYIRRFYHSLFTPLADAMASDPEKTKKLFGRYFTGYAERINQHSNENSRYNFINVTNDSNIEFRLNRFNNAKQYQALMKMEAKMVETIIANFCEHFNDRPTDTRRHPTRTAYRKHKAQVTANKLVQIFQKTANNL